MVFFWFVAGIIVGLLSIGAKMGWRDLYPNIPFGVWASLGLNIVAAIVGGWAGGILLGSFFSPVAAIWLSILASVVPWGIARLRRRAQRA